MVDMIIIGMVD